MKISNPSYQINSYIHVLQNNTDGGGHYMIGGIGWFEKLPVLSLFIYVFCNICSSLFTVSSIYL
ncbi:MAG: hypothetical protein DID91_2727704379 [Candidatus Nitrotoga sp. MKT]|nr:MAG: hypothetical protein DID91_2727704379 [Candidatus Nitrotoga sp. MKT]